MACDTTGRWWSCSTDNVEGLTAEALSELDKKIGRGSRVQRNVWKSMSQAWTYAISSRKREFLVEEGPNCWVRSTGSSLDFLLRKSIGWLQFAARTGAQSKNRFDIPFSEQVGGDWRELYTLPHKGSLFDDADDE
ncbi:MAG: hypothetical protein K8I27_00325 [Planctomycetes bacterium]|nr:hypothetical protein [Planctomycetota bacterium]